MTDFEDKTRIKPGSGSVSNSEDVTRVSGKINPASVNEDQTRVSARTPAQPDQTVVSNKSRNQQDNGQSQQNDVTRISFNKTPPVQTSQPVPPRTFPETVNTHSSSGTVVQKNSVLKQRFVLEDVIGSGGMGVVYKAKDLLKVEANDRDPYVAIKVLSEEFKSHPEAFVALQRESRKSQRIAHPNIVNVFDFDRDGDTVFMTMEYMEGKPLDKLLRQYQSTGLPSDDAWMVLDGICAALMHAHNERIVHSDFKPGNVFVTNRGIAKVFDFGIARAVAQFENLEGQTHEDRTLFDAGNLGALTPAYASLEMLEGETPDIRDDIYALGCVAYELFTGEHPFNKIPADEAARKKLKPKRISNITKNQWQVIEKALEFKRENRLQSVEEFVTRIKYKRKPAYLLAASAVIILTLSVLLYFQYIRPEPQGPDTSQIRSELEYQIRLELAQKNILKLIKEASFTAAWEAELWGEIEEIKRLLQGNDPWLVENTGKIYAMYIAKIEEHIKYRRYSQANTLVTNAYRYTSDTTKLDEFKAVIAQALQQEETSSRQYAAEQPVVQQPPVDKEIQKKKSVELFDLALNNVNKQLSCQAGLNMSNIEVAVGKLRSLDMARYNSLEPQIVKSLASCIENIGLSMSDRAMEYKEYAMRIFPSNRTIAMINIKPKDPCDPSLAGLGSRGQRTICKDKLNQGGTGPSLVVIPGSGSMKTFAIGKYEVSVAEINEFCNATKQCNVSAQSSILPASNINLDLVNSYLKWLSKTSEQKYRLPTKTEWLYAAKAKQSLLDPNRNCKLNTRGIQKGGELVSATTGQQNDWGLVNHIGNVQEWVYDGGSRLVAVGGSYEESMDNCNHTAMKSSDGNADMQTGFRVLREIKG